MKQTSFKPFLALALVLSCAMPLTALAGNLPGPEGTPHKHSEQNWETRQNNFFTQLNLNEDQKTRIKALMSSQHSKNKPERQALWNKHQQMMQMIKSGSGNRAQALALHREIAQKQNALMESRINFLYDMKEILTPEQFEKASQMMRQHAMGPHHKGGFRHKGQPAEASPNTTGG